MPFLVSPESSLVCLLTSFFQVKPPILTLKRVPEEITEPGHGRAVHGLGGEEVCREEFRQKRISDWKSLTTLHDTRLHR